MKTPFYKRYVLLALSFVIFGMGIVIQMIRINYTSFAVDLINKSEDYQGIRKLVYPERGTIYDRSGNILATNEIGYELGIDLKFVSDPESIAFAATSLVEGLDYGQIYDLASLEKQGEKENRYFVLSSYVSQEKIEDLERLEATYKIRREQNNTIKPNLSGLIWTPMLQRTYPENTLASNVLGFYNYFSRETAQGVYGIEESYNALLSGRPQYVFMPNNPYLVEPLPNIEPGASLILTIDREIQMMVQDTLADAIEWSGAESGTIIVSNPETGEILGMASTPFFNSNEYWNYQETFPKNTPYNRAVGAVYEPGSVFKVITMAAALDSGVATPESTYNDTSGVYWIAGSPIYNWNMGAWGEQTMTGCMQHSLNVCLAYVADELLGEDLFYQYLQDFGFGRSTGIDLAAEANFPLRLPTDNTWGPLDLATNSFGQGIAVTPIQMVTAISAIANEGKMMMPHIVKSVVDRGHQYDVSPQIINSPISAETATVLTEMLTFALEEEASVALVDGYKVAGKTGTGEVPTEFGYTSNLTNTSFVGWGPSDDPKFLVYIWLEKPTISKWGSEVAAPVFKDIVEKLVVLMHIPPDNVLQEVVNE
jgi:cell division protein FtsI/penicillin-binding protein 2